MNNTNKGNFNAPVQPFGSLLSLADLPTHLPNTVPISTKTEPEELSIQPAHNDSYTRTDNVVPHDDNVNERNNAVDGDEEQKAETSVDQIVVPVKKDTNVDTEKEKICIPGTSITLDTEEDIQKWIEERKKRWPTRKNIEEKEKAQKEKLNNQQQHHTSGDPNNKRTRDNNGSNSQPQDKKRQKRICHFYQQNKKCRFGAKCKNVHEQSGSPSSTSERGVASNRTKVSLGSLLPTSNACVVKTINDIQVNIPQRFKSEFYNTNPNSGTLFKMLVQKDHYENDNELILRFLEYLDKKKLIDHAVKL